MPCVKPDGTLEPVAHAVLQMLQKTRGAEEIARSLGLPLFRIRSSLRELVQAGLVAEVGDRYALTPAGEERVPTRP